MGYSVSEAQFVFKELTKKARPPYLVVGFSELGSIKNRASESGWNAADRQQHPALESAYWEFRKQVPSGRYALWIEATKEDEEQSVSLLDSQVADKAFSPKKN